MHSLLTPEKPDGHHVRRASVLMRSFAALLNWLFPLSFAATQLFEPLLQNYLLICVDARKHHPHSHIGEQKYHSSQRSGCRVCVRDSDPNLRAFWRRIQHVEKASADTQIAGPCAQFCVGYDFGYFSICDNRIAWGTTALGIHALPPSLVAKTRMVPVTRILAQASGCSNRPSAAPCGFIGAVFASTNGQTASLFSLLF